MSLLPEKVSSENTNPLEFIKVWYFDQQVTTNFDDNYDYFPKNTTFLLDTNKKSFSPIEKYVYDITTFHMNRIGTKQSECHVSFSLKEGQEVWTRGKGATRNVSPYTTNSSSDCMSPSKFDVSAIMHGFFYLQDYNFPQIFIDMDTESYKFKEFDNKNIVVSFPKKYKNFTWEDGTGNDSNTLLEGPNSDNITIQICEANMSKLTGTTSLTEASSRLLTVFFEIHTKKKLDIDESSSVRRTEDDRRDAGISDLRSQQLSPGVQSTPRTLDVVEASPYFDGKNAKTLYKNDKEMLVLTSGCISDWSNMDKSTMDPNLCSFVCPNHKIMRISHKEPDMVGGEDNSFITGKKYQPMNRYNEFTRDFMDELVYYPTLSTYEIFNKLQVDYPGYDLFLLPNLFQTTVMTPNRMIVEESNPKTLIDVDQPKFVQRFTFGQFLKPDSCEWIINESEIIAKQSCSKGWKKNMLEHYPTYTIELDTKVSLFRYIITQFKTILDMIIQSYSLHKDTNINVTNVFISKYNSDAQCCIEPGNDGSTITIQIMLSDISRFVGGGIQFDDHIVTKLKQGDMLLYNGNCKHFELPITHGVKYSIIIFTKVYTYSNDITKGLYTFDDLKRPF